MAAATPLEVVNDFCDAVNKQDLDAVIGYFSDDAVYHNIPLEPITGRDAIREALEGFLAMLGTMTFDTLHALADGPIVATERVDSFSNGDRTIELPVAGFFEVHDGKITAWRDYFDMGQVSNQMAG
jgi:limonene-1,2-epoxide hydrolase